MALDPRTIECDRCHGTAKEKEIGEGFPGWGGMKYVNITKDGSAGTDTLPWGALMGVLVDEKEPRFCPACMRAIINFIISPIIPEG